MSSDSVILSGPLADRARWQPDRCSLAAALRIVGTRSALLIMREAGYGTHRFEDFSRRADLSEAVTAARLRELTAAGLLERRPYREPGQRTRNEYVLTQSGRDLVPALVALMQWGDRYAADPPGGPLDLVHDGCGKPVGAEIRCAAGHEVPLEQIRVLVADPAHADAPIP